MVASTAHPVLDHIVILVRHHELENVPTWLAEAFTVLPGGRHADGLTENKLIIFEDGVYLEFIAFVPDADPEKRRAHRWGERPEGHIVDWAFTLMPQDGSDGEAAFTNVQQRIKAAHTGFTYANPVPGGRIAPDGSEMRWAVSGPLVDETVDHDLVTGELPFWCLDRTPRKLRVPLEKPGNIKHPSATVGVAGVTVFAKGHGWVNQLKRVYEAIVGEPAKMVSVDPVVSGYSWHVGSPVQLALPQPKVVLRSWSEETIAVRDAMEEEVRFSIRLHTKGRAGTIEGDLGKGRRLAFELVPVE